MDLWTIKYKGWDPDQESRREALFTLGNGYFASRGAGEEITDDQVHYPGTYLASGYNRLKSKVADEIIENEDFVNFPNWMILSYKPENGKWLKQDDSEILDYKQKLDLKKGILKIAL